MRTEKLGWVKKSLKKISQEKSFKKMMKLPSETLVIAIEVELNQ